MNVNESAWLRRNLLALGFEEAEEGEAEVYILNTCSVREKPVHKVHSLLGHLQRVTGHDPKVFVAVGGCVAQQQGQDFFKRFPQVRLVFGPDGTVNTPAAIERLRLEPGLRLSLLDFSENYADKDPRLETGETQPSAFVDIMQGCNNFCAYCIVPFVRGPQKSRPAASILAECEALLAQGTKEITLLGQNVNSYGQDQPDWQTNFAELLYKIGELPGLARLRFMTSHPKDIAPEVIAAFANIKALCPRLHLPLQSGSDSVLRRMGRKYTVERYLEVARALREVRPDLELSTDIIVGFPGESEADFEATLQVMKQVDFMDAYSFCYCDRPGARASDFLDKVPSDVAKKRLASLQAWQNERREQILKTRVGQITSVLLEGESRPTGPKEEQANKRPGPTANFQQPKRWQGRDPYGHIVNVAANAEMGPQSTKLASTAFAVGRLVNVRVTHAKKHSLLGVLQES